MAPPPAASPYDFLNMKVRNLLLFETYINELARLNTSHVNIQNKTENVISKLWNPELLKKLQVARCF